MIIDLSIIIIVALFVLVGWLRGGLSQLLSLAALTIAILVASLLSRPLATFLTSQTNLPPSVTNIGSFLIPLILVYLLILIVGRILIRRAHKVPAFRRWDRRIGAGFGGLKGVLIGCLLILLLDLIPDPIMEKAPVIKNLRERSFLASRLSHHNPLRRIKDIRKLEGFYRIQDDQEALLDLGLEGKR